MKAFAQERRADSEEVDFQATRAVFRVDKAVLEEILSVRAVVKIKKSARNFARRIRKIVRVEILSPMVLGAVQMRNCNGELVKTH